MKVEKISAITLRVENMRASVRFYRDVLGLEITYGGGRSLFFVASNERRQKSHSESRTGQAGYGMGAADFLRD